MITFRTYVEQAYPNHVIRTDDDPTMGEHSVVGIAEWGGSAESPARDWAAILHAEQTVFAVVEPTKPTIVPHGGEDPEGVIDLPMRRVLAAGAIGGLAAGSIVGVVVSLAVTVAAGVITGLSTALIIGIFAAIAGGGARFAGKRAWEQPNKPGAPLLVVAGFARDAHQAAQVARDLEQAGITDVRIVDADGRWHLPNT